MVANASAVEKVKVGIPDVPINRLEEDAAGLNVADYAEALSDFIRQTDTPMTIGIQGDWGSGKTSIMNLIRQRLEGQFATAWINTWKYSQTDPGQSLAAAVFLAIIHRLSKEYEIRTSEEKRAELLGKMGKALGNIVGRVTEAQIGFNIKEAFESGQPDEVFERFESLELLKGELDELVCRIVKSEKTPGDRVIIFVDDLDRVPPERAVEILEVLKVFLDIPGLVFVLACDYEVILQGLKSKGALAGEEVSGRSFFDKIIQVPFQMPRPDKEKLGNYLRTLLSRVGAGELAKDDVDSMIEVLDCTTGSNPRTIKRILNIVNLLLLILNSQKHTWDDNIDNKAAIVFSLVALQSAYPDVYASLSSRDEKNVFDAFSAAEQDLDPFFQRAHRKHPNLNIENLNKVLNTLQELLGGNASNMLNFLMVSDVATVQEKKPENIVPVTKFVNAFLKKLDPWQKDFIEKLIGSVPSVSVKKVSDEDAIRIVSSDDKEKRVLVYAEEACDEIEVYLGTIYELKQADELIEQFKKRGSKKFGRTTERIMIRQGFRIVATYDQDDNANALIDEISWYLQDAQL